MDNNCSNCDRNISSLNFSCQHLICYKCLYKTALNSVLEEISLNSFIRLSCLKCTQGCYTIEKLNFLHILEFNENENNNNICEIHKLDYELYCNECRTDLCITCFIDHKKINNNHLVHNNITGSICSYDCNHCKNISKDRSKYEEISTNVIDKFNNLKTKLYENQNVFNEIYNSLVININKIVTGYNDKVQLFCNELDLTRDIIIKCYGRYKQDEKKVININDLVFNQYLSTNEIKEGVELINKILNEQNNILKERDIFKVNNYKINYNLISTLSEHSGAITSLIQLQDGRLASASFDNTIKLWDQNYLCIHTLHGHDKFISSMIQLADGHLVTASGDSSLRLWDLEDLKCIKIVEAHSSGVLCIIQLKDNKIATGSVDQTIKIWQNWICISTLNGHTDCVSCLLELRDGRIVSSSYDNTIRVWEESNCFNVLIGHSNYVYTLIELKSGKILSGSEDGTIRVWNSKKNFKCIETIRGNMKGINRIIELRDDYLITGSNDNNIRILNLKENYKCVSILKGHMNYISSLICLNDGSIISGSGDKTIKIWK